MVVYDFNEFDSVLNFRLSLFTKATKYLKPFLEQVRLDLGITTFELADRINLSRKKMFKFTQFLAEKGIIYCAVRNGETYLTLTIKGRELLNYLEER